MQGRSMTEGAPWKHIVRFALPVLFGSLLQQLYSTVDTIIVGNFSGEAALSAVGTTGSMTFLFLAIAMGLSNGNGVVIAQYYGAKNEAKVRESASSGILFMMVLGVIATVFGIVIAGPTFEHLIKVPGDILGPTIIYFRVYMLGIIFQYGYNIFSSILRAIGDSAATLYFLLTSSVANVVLDLLFVAGFHWGVAGAAAATDLAQFGSFLAAYLYMTRKYPLFRFKLRELVWSRHEIGRTVRIGLPISVQLMVVSIGLTFIQRAVNEFGKAMTASFTVGHRIEQYINMPCNAMHTTLATYTGQNIGAGKMDRVKKGVRQAFVISIVMTLVISAAIWIFAGNIITLFGLSDDAAALCLQHLKAVAFVNMVLALYIPLFGVFQGTGHSGVPTVVATCALTVRVFVVYLLRYSPFLGYTIIWWNSLFGFGLGCLISWSYYFSGRWKKVRE